MAMIAIAAMAQSSMTDQQVLDYVKRGLSQGKSQKIIMQELVTRGVDRAQAQRVRRLYEKEMAGGQQEDQDVTSSASDDRSHSTKKSDKARTTDKKRKADKEDVSSTKRSRLSDEYEEEGVDYLDEEYDDDYAELYADPILDKSNEIYGHNIFLNKKLSFAPSASMPTPVNYVLGAGDEVIVDIYGANQSTIRSVITPEGYINVEVLGPVYLSGKTISEANAYLKKRLSSIYEGLANEEETEIQLSLGQIRSIQVTIMGEVPNPGTFMVNSLSTVFHAMFTAGGVSDIGTVRAIKLIRKNKTVASVDVYDLLTTGSRKSDVRLEEGDIILVDPYTQLVKLNGQVKRPMKFEMKPGETVSDLLKYAGGFDQSSYTGSVSVVRQSGHNYVVRTVNSSEFSSFALEDGDEVEVLKMEARFENKISVTGAVKLPGVYELGEVKTVKQLIEKAGGLQPEAFTDRVVIHREREDKTLETKGVNLSGIYNGTVADVPLCNKDELFVPSIFDMEDQGVLVIRGEVAKPDTIPYAANTTIQDLIIHAGGLLRSASVVRIDVDRLVEDEESFTAQSEIAQHFTFNMKDGFAVDDAMSFVLEPYDVVTVRRSPSYVPGKTVTVSGEVNFPGVYNMNKREERVSDLVDRAGELTDFAYAKGAHITRVLTESERELAMTAVRAMVNNGDSLVPVLRDNYTVALDLEKALKNPGSEYDLVLREGDVLEIPVFNNTVRIGGAVQLQTTVTYEKGLNKRKLVDMAGGYLKRAYKTKAFIVYMNGKVAKLKWNTPIEPGCQVFIPIKAKKNGAANVTQALSIASATASLGMMGVSIANLLK